MLERLLRFVNGAAAKTLHDHFDLRRDKWHYKSFLAALLYMKTLSSCDLAHVRFKL
jgi:hypothetical protein